MSEPTTLGRRCLSDAFRPALASFLREQASLARTSRGFTSQTLTERRHGEALGALADYVAQLGLDDQRLRILETCQISSGKPKMHYTPGALQARMLATLGGIGAPPPDTDAVLNELAGLAVDDLVSVLNARFAALNDQRDRDAKRVSKVDRIEERAQATKDDLAAVRTRLKNAEAQVKQVEAERDHLRALVADIADEPLEAAA